MKYQMNPLVVKYSTRAPIRQQTKSTRQSLALGPLFKRLNICLASVLISTSHTTQALAVKALGFSSPLISLQYKSGPKQNGGHPPRPDASSYTSIFLKYPPKNTIVSALNRNTWDTGLVLPNESRRTPLFLRNPNEKEMPMVKYRRKCA